MLSPQFDLLDPVVYLHQLNSISMIMVIQPVNDFHEGLDDA
jgi:hypothetical protein